MPNTPQVDPISGLPIHPAGTQATTVSSNIPAPVVNYDQQAPQTAAYTPPPLEMGTNTQAPPTQTYAPPVSETTAQPETPPASTTQQTYAPPASETQVNPETPTTAAPNMVTAPTQPNATAPVKTEPSLDDNLANFEKIATDWANGVVDDKVFRTTANRAILQMGLNNQAETDALQMKINSDPALRGQGAGTALLSMMAANHGFSADQMFGQLAQSAQEKILDMQKYGLQEGVAINQMRRQNDYTKLQMLQDAGDFSGAAQLAAKISDFPGVSISPTGFSASRARLTDDAQSLIAAGNYTGAAEKLSALTGQPVDATAIQSRDPKLWTQAQELEDKGDFAGASKMYASLGLSVSADDLRSQSPFQQQTWTNSLDAIKALTATNPAAATALLDTLMKNPAAAKYLGFTPDMKAADLINSIVTGQYQANQDMRAGIQSEINLQAKSNVGFSQALVNYKALGPQVWAGMTMDGQKMAASNLSDFNQARQSMGMSEVHKDAQGNIVDANGTALTDEDFAQTAAAADYTSRTDKMKTQPWQAAYDNLMAPDSPMRDKILSLPGGEQSVKESLQMLYLGGGYKLDPATQTMVPDYTGGMPWENPSTEHLFHNWPLAQFNDDGTVNGKYDLGGETYGDKVGDNVIQKLPDDEALDDAYAKYKYNKGTLSASQWYFATAAGTKAEDKTQIPKELVTADATNVGTTTTTDGTTGSSTTGSVNADGTVTPKTDSTADKYKQFDDILATSSGWNKDQVADMSTKLKNTANINGGLASTGMVPLNSMIGADYDAAAERLRNQGVTNLDNIISGDKTETHAKIGSFDTGIYSTHKEYTGTQAFADYAIYAKLLTSGMKIPDAQTALNNLLGADRAKKALNLEPENQVSSDMDAAINKVR